MQAFITIENLSVKLSGHPVLQNISFTIQKQQQWAITGPSGSGKTILANAIMGRHFCSGLVDFHLSAGVTPPTLALVEQQHHFKNRSHTSDLYYQQRYNASESEDSMTVAEAMEAPTGGNDQPDWLHLLQLTPLLHKPLLQLSNGENKRLQLANALLGKPDLLILDNPFTGLDAAGRALLHDIINSITTNGIQVLLITAPTEMPDCITHVAVLEKGKLVAAGSRETVLSQYTTAVVTPPTLDAGLLSKITKPALIFEAAVKMVNVRVQYGAVTILQNLTWEVKKGECWCVSGPNGAGKSTLLSLINGDNPQAYANEIYLFDRRRGSGESIWDIKQQTGFLSPELHLHFDISATCFEVVASGLFDTIGLFRQLNQEQSEQVQTWLQLLQLAHLQQRRLPQLSTGEQRMVLLARAMVKNPPLLILDEPCQGLDAVQAAWLKAFLQQICKSFGTTLLYISHYSEDIPACVNRVLQLSKGQHAIITRR